MRDQTEQGTVVPTRHEGAVGAGWRESTELGAMERLSLWGSRGGFRGLVGRPQIR